MSIYYGSYQDCQKTENKFSNIDYIIFIQKYYIKIYLSSAYLLKKYNTDIYVQCVDELMRFREYQKIEVWSPEKLDIHLYLLQKYFKNLGNTVLKHASTATTL